MARQPLRGAVCPGSARCRLVGLLLPRPSTDTGCHQLGPRDLASVAHQCPLASIASDGGSYSLGYPAALPPLTFPVTAGPVDRETADDQGDGAEHDPHVGHGRSVSAYTFRQGRAGRNLLIRRDMRAHLPSAHTPLTCRNVAHRCAVGGGIERHSPAKIRPA